MEPSTSHLRFDWINDSASTIKMLHPIGGPFGLCTLVHVMSGSATIDDIEADTTSHELFRIRSESK